MTTATSAPRYLSDADRIRKRLSEGRSLAASIVAILKRDGVTAEIFGSMSTGRALPNSDVDILVTDRGGVDKAIVLHKVSLIPKTIPVDVVFLEDVPPESLSRILESRHG